MKRGGLAAAVLGMVGLAATTVLLSSGGGGGGLPVAPEHQGGYDRTDWGREWPARVNHLIGWDNATCQWAFYARGPERCGQPGLSRDHMVPVEDAYASGGWKWSAEKRRRFYYDISNLFVMPLRQNEGKGDKDPAGWLPEHNQCRYLRGWVETKNKYGLTADQAEKDAIVAGLARC